MLTQNALLFAVVKYRKMAALTCMFVCAFLSPERVLPVRTGGMIRIQVMNFASETTSLRNLGENAGI